MAYHKKREEWTLLDYTLHDLEVSSLQGDGIPFTPSVNIIICLDILLLSVVFVIMQNSIAI